MSWAAPLFLGVFLTVSSIGLWSVMSIDRSRQNLRRRIHRAAFESVPMDLRPADGDRAGVPSVRPRTPDRGLRYLSAELRRSLAQSGWALSPLELMGALLLVGLVVFATTVMFIGPTVALALAGTLPIILAQMLIKAGRARRLARFTREFDQALEIFNRGLKAGRPIPDSLDLLIENTQGPLQEEFAKCREEIRFGTPMTDAFTNLALRVPTPEVQYFSVATALQSETGGNLVETIANLAEQLRERRKLAKKARSLSAEVRVSAAILAALPFIVGMIIVYLNPTYIVPLFIDLRGRLMLIAGLVSICLGILIMFRMAKFDA